MRADLATIKPMEELFKGHGWRVTMEEATLPDGRKKKAARVQRADAAHILAFTEEGHLLMLREYRPFYEQYIWMLPSGKVDKETDLATAAMRELQEETGFRAKKLEYWCSTNHSETFVSTNHIFIAHDLVKDPLPQDDDELIEVHVLPLEEAVQKIINSPKVHTVSAYAVLRYLHDHPKK